MTFNAARLVAKTIGILVVISLFRPAPLAAQILMLRPSTLTGATLPASAAQGYALHRMQRGVMAEGSELLPWTTAVELAGNPFESSNTESRYFGGVDLVTGSYATTEVDLAFPARVPWTIGRSYSSVSASAFNSPQGFNWSQLSQSELIQANADTIYLAYGCDRYAEFARVRDSTTTFRGINGTGGVLLLNSSTSVPIEYHDQKGDIVYFFGFDGTQQAGQLWKIVGPDGEAAYVGHKTDATQAKSIGYSGARIVCAYDSAGRKYTYAYATQSVSGYLRLASVQADQPDGSGWLTVGRVDYKYTDGASLSAGAGDLSVVEIRMPTDRAGEQVLVRQHYRYHDGSTGGPAHAISLVVGEEAARRYAWGASGNNFESFDFAALESIDTCFVQTGFTYESTSSGRIATAWFDGMPSSTYSFVYLADNTSYTDNTSTYEQAVARRTLVHQPEKWVTYYFDEAGQACSTLVSDSDPRTTPTLKWAYCLSGTARRRSFARVRQRVWQPTTSCRVSLATGKRMASFATSSGSLQATSRGSCPHSATPRGTSQPRQMQRFLSTTPW